MPENTMDSKISRKRFLKYTGATALGTATTGFNQNDELRGEESLGYVKSKKNNISPEDIIIENNEIRLVITPNGIGKSLTYKPTNSECLMQDTKVPVFSMVQYRPYSGQARAHAIPLERHTFAAHSVRREADKLIVGFDIVDIYAIIDVTINSQYVQFSVNGFARSNNIGVKGQASNATPSVPEVDEMWFLQLPVRNGTRFGKWLNVMWNDELAVNVLGTDPYARIDSEERNGYRILKAGVFDIKGVKTEGTGAGLIATHPDNLLDNIARIEEDFHLPHGAQNRASKGANIALFKTSGINPENVTGI